MTEQMPKKESWIYRFARVISPICIPMFFRCKTPQLKELSIREGPFIIFSNHISMWDPVVISTMLMPRRTYFMAKAELHKNKWLNKLLTALGSIPVNRGENAMQAIRNSLKVLKGGDVFVIFPEGTRNKEKNDTLLPFYNGLSLIALKANVPCIPIYIENKNAYRIFHHTHIKVGTSIDFQDLTEKKRLTEEVLQIATDRMAKSMMALIPSKETTQQSAG